MALLVKPGEPTVALSAYRFTPNALPVTKSTRVVKSKNGTLTVIGPKR